MQIYRRLMSLRFALTLIAVTLVHGAFDVKAQPASAVQWVTLGTQGGPILRHSTAQISNALVVDDSIYLFDMGSSVLRQMEGAGLSIGKVRAAFITHHHRDHNADTGAVIFEHAAWKATGAPPLKLLGPTGTEQLSDALVAAHAARVAGAGESPRTPIHLMVESTDFPDLMEGPTRVYRDDTISVSAITVDHYYLPPGLTNENAPRAVAYRVEVGSDVFVYSGDTGAETPALETLSQEADVLICEVILGQIPDFGDLPRSHVGPEHIAAIAKAANVKSVVLTHYTPAPPWNQSVIEDALSRMRPIYQGNVTAARDLDRFNVDGNRIGGEGIGGP